MKILKILVALMLMLSCGYGQARAQKSKKKTAPKKEQVVKPKEETPSTPVEPVDVRAAAEDALYAHLRTLGMHPAVDKTQNSINFSKDQKDYFIRITGDANPLLYTLYIKSLNFGERNGLSAEERRKIALTAANTVCAQSHIQMFMDGALLHFKAPAYVASVDEYFKVLPAYMEEISKVRENYANVFNKQQALYIDEKARMDSIAAVPDSVVVDEVAVVQEEDDNILVVQQPCEPEPQVKSIAPLLFSGFAIRVVNADDKPIVDYNKALRKTTCTYLQEKVEVIANTNDEHVIGVKIYTPKGRLMLPSKDAAYTTKVTVNLKKDKKPQEIELKKFGYDMPDQWAAGEYTIEFYDNGTPMHTDSFTIL